MIFQYGVTANAENKQNKNKKTNKQKYGMTGTSSH